MHIHNAPRYEAYNNSVQRQSPDSAAASRLFCHTNPQYSPERASPSPMRLSHMGGSVSPPFFPATASQFRTSTRDSPSRISAYKKVTSAALPGGLQLNATHNDPYENAIKREHNRVAGFGPGIGGAIIGNATRRGNSLLISDCKDIRKTLGTIGWGIDKPSLDQGVWRRILPDMQHKKAYDFGGLKYLPHMDTTGKFAQHLDNQLGIPYEMLDEMSVREQRLVVKKRIAEMRKIENFKIRSQSKSPTKPINTTQNTKLFLKQLQSRNGGQAQALTHSALQSQVNSQFERRSRSNIPYQKKPGTTRSETSDIFGDITTAATASPTLRQALSIQSDAKSPSKLYEVSEFPFPKNAITNDYKKSRLLKKGSPKLMKLVEKHQAEVEKSIQERNRLSQRLMSNMDRVKLSIMSTRSNNIHQTHNAALNNVVEDRLLKSGFNTSKNAYVKQQLTKAHKNNSSGPSNIVSMNFDDQRYPAISSELKTVEKHELQSKAHVPKLLLTQAIQFQSKDQQLVSYDANEGDKTADSIMMNSPEGMAISQENPLVKHNLHNNTMHSSILQEPEEGAAGEMQGESVQTQDGGFSAQLDSPHKKYNPVNFEQESTMMAGGFDED